MFPDKQTDQIRVTQGRFRKMLDHVKDRIKSLEDKTSESIRLAKAAAKAREEIDQHHQDVADLHIP